MPIKTKVTASKRSEMIVFPLCGEPPNLSTFNGPERNSQLVLSSIYQTLDRNAILGILPIFRDIDVLRSIDDTRYPSVPGDKKSNRICFDFSVACGIKRDVIHYYDLTSYALKFNHFLTVNTLLREEKASWAGDIGKLIRGSSREIVPDVTWFGKILILASNIYELFKDEVSDQAELKEFLQGLLQESSDVLNEHVPINKSVHIKKLNTIVRRDKESSTFSFAFINYFSPEAAIIDARSATEDVSILAETYGLTPGALLERKNRIARLVSGDISEEERPQLKKYLRVRLNLSALMHDRILFEECLGDFSRLHQETLIDLIIDLYLENKGATIGYLLKSLAKEQAQELIDHIFEIMHPGEIKSHLGSKFPAYSPAMLDALMVIALKGLCDVINTLIDITGDYQLQINYLYASLEARLHTDDLGEDAFRFITNTLVYFYTIIPMFRGLHTLPASEEVLPKPIMTELENYPLLITYYAGQLHGLHTVLVSSMEILNSYSEKALEKFCKDFWQGYLYSMWVEFNHLPLGGLTKCFQTLDYWLENLFKNKSRYPHLHDKIVKILIGSDYFSNKKFEYFFKYRLDELRTVSRKIWTTEQVRISRAAPLFAPEDFELLPKSTNLDTALDAHKDSIYAQLDLIKQWLAQDLKDKSDAAKPAGLELMIGNLIIRTPLAKLVMEHALRSDGKELSVSVFDYLITLVNDTDRFSKLDYNVFLDTLSFDRESARATLLLYLFSYDSVSKTTSHPKLIKFMNHVLTAISFQIDYSPEKIERFVPLLEEMAQHGFFKRESHNMFSFLFYNRFISSLFADPAVAAKPETTLIDKDTATLRTEPRPSGSGAVVVSDEETESAEEEATKPHKKRRRRKHATVTHTGTSTLVLTPLLPPELIAKMVAALTLPSVVLKPVAAGAGAETVAEEYKEIAIEPSCSSSPSPRDIAIENLRKIRQELSKTIKVLMMETSTKMTGHREDSFVFLQYKRLLDSLQNSQNTTLGIRKMLKDISAKEAGSIGPEEMVFSVPTLFEQLQHYHMLVEKMSESAAEIGNCTELTYLINKLNTPSIEEILSPYLLEKIRLPSMPVAIIIKDIFSKHAQLSVYGSSLFLMDPLDIDLRLVWNDPTVPIAVINDIFKTLIEKAGFEISGTRELIGATSVTLRARGDGYHISDHKEIDITLQLTNPASRPTQLHHNSHSAATHNFTTGLTQCDLPSAKDILEGVFSIRNHTSYDPTEVFKAQVQILSALMRAWSESLTGTLKLHIDAQDLITKIAKHRGNWATFKAEDPLLADALRGMIVRHFSHYQPGSTYRARTQMLFNFLKMLGIGSIEECVATAVKDLITDDLSSYRDGMTALFKTEAFLGYCRELSLPIEPLLKAPLSKAVAKHFAIYTEGSNYLIKTALLLDFCRKHSFRLMAKVEFSGKLQNVELLMVDVMSKIIHFSNPVQIDVPDDFLLFEPGKKLIEANRRALTQLRVAQFDSMTVRSKHGMRFPLSAAELGTVLSGLHSLAFPTYSSPPEVRAAASALSSIGPGLDAFITQPAIQVGAKACAGAGYGAFFPPLKPSGAVSANMVAKSHKGSLDLAATPTSAVSM